jgi:hypothetical protein
MVVKTQTKARGVTGLNIGAANVRRYFPKHICFIELHLDHLQIQCTLDSGFWQDEPEIRDPRLGAWLDAKRLQSKLDRSPLSLVMVPAGNDAFRLCPVTLTAQSKVKQPSEQAA